MDALETLTDFAADLGRTPTRREIDEHDGTPASSAYRRAFGSWNDALQQAGLAPRRRTQMSDDELLEALRSVAADLGRTPLMSDILLY